ncbi:MAG TPA: dephospho-CoA kinase [Armatimonadota bacterium]|nr:dephospho-CoA kinase [Armatimonadota bacterium]
MSIVLGITGGIATGKSTVAEMFRELGAEVLSADEIARDVLAPGTPAANEAVRRFGNGILAPDGSINRRALGEIVFKDPQARVALNDITHPRIIEILEDRVNRFCEKAKEDDVLVVEIPLLVECNLSRLVDKVIVVAAEQDTQIHRLTTRGLSAEEARNRISAQMPIRQKIPLADWVIWTENSLEETLQQVMRVWEQVGKSRNRTE